MNKRAYGRRPSAKRRSSRRKRSASAGFAHFVRGLVLEGLGVLAIVAIFFLLRFDPADRPDWLFGNRSSETSLVNSKSESVHSASRSRIFSFNY